MLSKLFRKPDKTFYLTLAVFLLVPVYQEILLHLFVYKSLSARIVYPVLFSMAGGALLFMLCSLLPKKAGRIVGTVLLLLVTLYFEVQFVYNSIFGEFMSLWQVTFGATAITNFFRQMLYGIWKVLPQILVLLFPAVGGAVLLCRGTLQPGGYGYGFSAAALVLFVVLHFASVGVMAIHDNSAFSTYRLYKNVNTATEISVKNVGLLATTRLEGSYLLLGESVEVAEEVDYTPTDGGAVLTEADEVRYNMLDIDFDELADSTDSDLLKKLDSYFAAQMPTEKTDYTGMLSDYNLVVLCCESYSPLFIDEELTPALYELSHNGFVFNNYYGSYGSNTTNGEYTLCMGLFPDLSRSKSTASFYASQQNYLPYCLGNLFRSRGAGAYAYHNYTGEYYSRNVTHPNMGYTFKSAGDGLDITINWPTSDLEMMEESVDDYIDSGEQFVAYYMTFSGHYQYNWDNPMSAKNKAAVAALPYGDTVKAYIACNLELEYALEYLMDRLEQAGIADKTAIVLTNDHYPYGLTEEEYNELAGHAVDTTFEKYRNSFICYVPGMQEEVDTYCSTVDILPTLLNLFGFHYDSRLLAGRDVLSPQAENVAILSDQSFITPDFAFDTSTGELRVFGDNAPSDEQIAAIQQRIAARFQVSTDMLGCDYFAHALLGREDESGEAFRQYTYTDIPNTFNLGGLDFVIENGYMEPMSDTKFGFDTPCSYAELLDVLYRISGSPYDGKVDSVRLDGLGSASRTITGKYAPAVAWARDNGLISERQLTYMDSFTVVSRRSAALTLYRFAKLQGYDTSVAADLSEAYRASGARLTDEEQAALGWCYESSIMRASGTVQSSFEQADTNMIREYIITSVYNFYLRYAQ